MEEKKTILKAKEAKHDSEEAKNSAEEAKIILLKPKKDCE